MTTLEHSQMVCRAFVRDNPLPAVAWLMGFGEVHRLMAECEAYLLFRGTPSVIQFGDLPVYTLVGFSGIAMLDRIAFARIGKIIVPA